MKKKILFMIIFTALFSTFLIFTFSAFNKLSEKISKKSEINIIIDAGHGGEDGGAIGCNNILEKDINLDIALKLNDYLQISGFNTKMIRNTDISIFSEGASTVHERKVSDLKNRLEIFNSNKNNIVVSIHQNKFEQSKYHGTQVFYSKNSPDSNILAESIKNSVTSLLQPENTRETKPADKNIYLLYNAKVPAIITECGFISNPEEAALLNNEEYRKKMAFSIYCGILDYLEIKENNPDND